MNRYKVTLKSLSELLPYVDHQAVCACDTHCGKSHCECDINVICVCVCAFMCVCVCRLVIGGGATPMNQLPVSSPPMELHKPLSATRNQGALLPKPGQ